MGRAEISWKMRTAEGEKREVYAKHVGNQWLFYDREKRFDDWQPLAQPASANQPQAVEAGGGGARIEVNS
jgi:hypothetical protein